MLLLSNGAFDGSGAHLKILARLLGCTLSLASAIQPRHVGVQVLSNWLLIVVRFNKTSLQFLSLRTQQV